MPAHTHISTAEATRLVEALTSESGRMSPVLLNSIEARAAACAACRSVVRIVCDVMLPESFTNRDPFACVDECLTEEELDSVATGGGPGFREHLSACAACRWSFLERRAVLNAAEERQGVAARAMLGEGVASLLVKAARAVALTVTTAKRPLVAQGNDLVLRILLSAGHLPQLALQGGFARAFLTDSAVTDSVRVVAQTALRGAVLSVNLERRVLTLRDIPEGFVPGEICLIVDHQLVLPRKGSAKPGEEQFDLESICRDNRTGTFDVRFASLAAVKAEVTMMAADPAATHQVRSEAQRCLEALRLRSA